MFQKGVSNAFMIAKIDCTNNIILVNTFAIFFLPNAHLGTD